MKRLFHTAILSLTLGTVGHFSAQAAPAQTPGVAGALTDWKAFQRYGYHTELYLDVKGSKFLIYSLKGDGRLMLKLLPDKMEGEGIRLSSNWKAERGGQGIKMGQRYVPGIRRTTPQAGRTPTPTAPHDRYHPGIKLLARSGQE